MQPDNTDQIPLRRSDPSVKRLVPLWLTLAVVAIYATSIAIVGSSFQPRTGFPLDDSWIHQTVARNFAAFHSLGYFPHQISSGSTSLLWTLVLSLNYSLLPHLNPVVFCLVVNGACLIAIGLMLLRIALVDGIPPWLALLWAAAPALDGNFVWLAYTGMEHILFVTLSLAFVSLWLASESPHRRATALAAGLVLGALVMTRPEGIVLGALLLLPAARHLLDRRKHRTLSEAGLAALVAVPLASSPFVVNLLTSHTLLPVTFKGRRWMYSVHNGTPLDWRTQIVEQWITRVFKTVTPLDGSKLSMHGRHVFDLITLGILVPCVLGICLLVRRRHWRTLLICTWGAVHSLLYLVLLPTSGHGGRYQPFLLLLFLPLLALGLSFTADLLGARKLVWRLIAPTACLLAVATISLPLWRQTLASDVAHIESSHGAMAAYLQTELPHTTIAIFDIGRIGYTRIPYLLDLGGLTDASYVDFLIRGEVPQYLREKEIDLVVLPSDDNVSAIGNELGIQTGSFMTLTPIHTDCTPPDIWRLAWIQTKSAVRCQQLNRITYR